jgi:hypothetical protein
MALMGDFISFFKFNNILKIQMIFKIHHSGLEAVFRRIINPIYRPDWIYDRTKLSRDEMGARKFFYKLGDDVKMNLFNVIFDLF